jgi:exopolysaccharide production protein ExoQ
MPRAPTSFQKRERALSSGWAFDRYALIPLLACAYATIVFPLIIASCAPTDTACLLEARPESKIFWPLLAAISLIWAARNYSRLTFPPLIICLLAYLAFAGASTLWAFKPETSFIRFAQQAMIIVSIVVPAMLAARRVDLIRGLFLCFALAAILNLVAVFTRPPIDIKFATWGYPGYFSGKNYLGQFATLALLLSLHEALHPGRRRAFGIIIGIVSVALLILSNSKTSMALAVLAPALAGVTLFLRKKTRLSPAILLATLPIGYLILSSVSGFSVYRLSNILYGDPTFTGRSIIWDFVSSEIAQRPLLGWGYQSFWLVGPDAPSIVNAPGWVKDMPNAHNGYFDTMVEMGYVGYVLLVTFVVTTLHAIGRVADRAPMRAWIILSLALHVIITNGLESVWMRGFEMLWIAFLIVAVEVARHWRLPLPARMPVRGARRKPGGPPGTTPGRFRPGSPSRGMRRPVAPAMPFHPDHASEPVSPGPARAPVASETSEGAVPAIN